MSKALFKDYKKIAQLINQFDVVGVTELIPLVANDFDNNLAVVEFIKKTPDEIKELNADVKRLKKEQSKKYSVVRDRQIILSKKKIAQLKRDLKKAASLYRQPGYLKILTELQKLKSGNEWALIIAPRGEAAETSPTVELVGYYYRASVVKPKENDYCKDTRKFGRATPLACIVNMSEADLGEDKSHVFSRRPFLAEFISGRFSFVLLTSHIIFDSPSDESLMQKIVSSAFGVNSYEELGIGVQKGNYARFSEVKVTLDFIQRFFNKNKNKDIIYMGDFNLESENQFWPEVLSAWEGSQLYVTEKTSTNQARYNADGEPTNGVTSNYDHFIFNPKITKECINRKGTITGGAFDFQTGTFGKMIDKVYKIREESLVAQSEYQLNQEKSDSVYQKYVAPYLRANSEKYLTIGKVTHTYQNKHKIISKGIIQSTNEMEFFAKYFQERVMDSQLNDSSYYYFYEQLMSDHLPIYMECNNQ